MTVNVETIALNAAKLKPAKVFMWVIGFPFLVIGVVLRLLWLLPAFLIMSGIEGWKFADQAYQQWQARAREPGARTGW